MLFNRLNTNMHARQSFDTVCYVHKKFGVIREIINTTKLKKQDGLTNQPKRFKVEALKSKTSDTNGPGKKIIIVGTKTENKIKNKPLDMPALSSQSLTSRQTKVKRIEPLKGPCRPVLDDISAKPLQPMVEPRIKRIKPLKGPYRLVPQPLQQQQPRGPAVVRKYLDDISAMPPKPLQPMVEPCFKRIEPLKGPFRPVPLPLQQPPNGPFRYVPLPLLQPLKGSFRPVPLPLQQPLNGPFRYVPLPFLQPLKEPFRSLAMAHHQQQISVLGKILEDFKKMPDPNCKLNNSEPNMTMPHLTNTTLRSANKKNLIKNPKEKFVESNSKEANANKPSNKRKINKETTPRLSPVVVKAKIETLSTTGVNGKQKNCQQPMQASDLKQATTKKTLNKRKYNKKTTSKKLQQAVQAPTLNSLKNKTENNMYVCSEESKSTTICGCIKQA